MNISALITYFTIAARRTFAELMVLGGQMATFAALLISYAVVFKAVLPATLGRYGLTANELIWYATIAQLIGGSGFYQYKELQHDIRSEAMEIMLLRPIAVWQTRLSEWLGQNLTRLLLMLPFAGLLAWGLTGAPPGNALSILLLIPSLLVSGLIFLGWHYLIGCTTLWVDEAEAVYRFWQKTLFLLGGRFWPLIIYPVWMQHVAWLTPFPAIYAVPANLTLGEPPQAFMIQFADQLFWLGLTLTMVMLMTGLVRRRLAAGDH